MAIFSTFSGWLFSFPTGQLLSKVFERGWDKLVAGCLIKHMQVQKVQHRLVLGLCTGVFNNTRYFGQGQIFLTF